jgi:hypothetical protein
MTVEIANSIWSWREAESTLHTNGEDRQYARTIRR